MNEPRRGVVFGASAYFVWGLFPLYWPLLKPATAFEILGHRIVWSLVVLVALLARARAFHRLRAIRGPKLRLLTLAAGFIALNWGLYIWAVNHGHVVETALGYFINPLVSVLLGVVVLRERMRRAQWIALGLVVVAVTVLAVDYGGLPWIAIVLPISFGLYGLHKKRADVGAVESLTFETALLVVPAIAYLAWLEHVGAGVFAHPPWSKTALLVLAGPATAVPLLCFGAAAIRIPLSTLGLLQYISPTLQFLCGVYVFHEAMPPSRWVGFGLVWIALLVFSADSFAHRRRRALA